MDLKTQIFALVDNNKEMSKAETEAGEEGPTVTEADIQHIVSSWTGIPVEKVSTDKSDRLLKMEETLHTRIISQDEALKAISRAIRRARVGLKNPDRPIANFMFSAPTGVCCCRDSIYSPCQTCTGTLARGGPTTWSQLYWIRAFASWFAYRG
ncbi:putative P-loop containing nucleoside triphosphate hydrolase [Helianthus annuus]|uniref:P-loop containing nucleoside triphosphate hydrolase n=1 Tax=Helianthus annuus TaxID=4232 RepID=A0A251UAS0_HELAN|nr:putative P-loop containing nucleoside triphosphate hydrolase [Helianthus annuus]KAJ0549190.1 putative P-loop containing nucleoside triphosphate hydrolase [Helianthus annuus]KAJ0562142.1 putative P-loop containing nucleoside triphosphate hydrolase [Helianthus annuus]KAJ0730313.1 putative P-loop containing nucleoside triphosphate hydrolase [Helianthus annuus]KAJ0798917.1 putative P-loop containing nucleoside triphosphate hydrolase [Helianthus annuus]